VTIPSLLQMTAPCREDFSIPFHAIGDAQQDFAVALVAGVHGNELNGVFVLARLADYLHEVERGVFPGIRLEKRVLIVPAVNVLGLNTRMRLWPFDRTDLNRMFPGYELGETTQRIAAAVLKATQGAAIRIDIHTGNQDFEELPHVRLYEPSETERAQAADFGLSALVESPIEKVLTVSLIQAWKSLGGTNFVLRAGQGGNVQLTHCERLFQSLLDFLHHRGILSGKDWSEAEEDQHYFGSKQNFRVITEQAGFFVSKLEVGQWLQAGDLIGYLYDGFTGKARGEVHAPVAGLLLGLRRQPLVFEGDQIARLQCLE